MPKAGAARGERGAVDVERLLDDVEEGRRADSLHDGVAERRPGEPEDLRERAQDDDRAARLDVLLASSRSCGIDVLDVGLVDDDGAAVGDGGEQRSHSSAREQRAGGVVRVAEPDQPGVVLARGRGERLDVVARSRPGRRSTRAPAAAETCA